MIKYVLLAVVCMVCGGCLDDVKATQATILETQAAVSEALNLYKVGLEADVAAAAEGKQKEVMEDALGRLDTLETVVNDLPEPIQAITDVVANADNAEDMAWGVGEVLAGLTGVSAIFGVLHERRKRQRADNNLARTESVIRNSSISFTQGEMAQLPGVIRNAAISNGNAT